MIIIIVAFFFSTILARNATAFGFGLSFHYCTFLNFAPHGRNALAFRTVRKEKKLKYLQLKINAKNYSKIEILKKNLFQLIQSFMIIIMHSVWKSPKLSHWNFRGIFNKLFEWGFFCDFQTLWCWCRFKKYSRLLI